MCHVFGDRCIESFSGKTMAPLHRMVGSGVYEVDDAELFCSQMCEQGLLEHDDGRVYIHNSTIMHFDNLFDAERRVDNET
ncbi:hypothetical protein CCR75_004334 [Bremia lactucae]|uniref:Uncharacterized protein n=1 Tax=Bremia lactucae TaxID=4779 RepID=A0A976FKW8_BRELC|nr:hypothetical protein CCR75_004334 [Bremia lactucae]